MSRTSARPRPDRERVLVPARSLCLACGGAMRIRYENRRTVVLLSGPVRLRLKVRRCEREGCARHRVAYRPEAEGAIALAQHEFGLDVVALVGTLRHHGPRSVPEIHAALRGRGVEISERSVTNLLDRYDELLAVSLTDGRRLRTVLAKQGRAILALDGMQPDGGHEVLWVVRECLSGEVLLARSLLWRRPLAHPHQSRRVRPTAQLRLQHPQGQPDRHAQPGPLPRRSRRHQKPALTHHHSGALNSPAASRTPGRS